MSMDVLYDDGSILCDATGVLIRRYYPWGSKRVPYASVRAVSRLPLRIRRWRLWGSGDFRHWWNLDLRRPGKTVALVLDTGRAIHPTITPEDVDAVEAIIVEHLAAARSL